MTQTINADSPVLEQIKGVIDNARADRVFGTPITEDGVTVLPVARVSGGGGGGSGVGPAEQSQVAGGSGGGFGLTAKALGVFVIKDGRVSWRPAVDINKVILGGQLVMLTALLVARAVLKARARRLDA